MRNFILTIQKLKNILNNTIIKAVLISFVTMIVTLSIVAGVIWHYHTKIFRILATGYVPEQQLLDNIDSKVADSKDSILKSLPIPQKEDNVIDAVKTAKPAVVSIIISKEVPKYDVTYQTDPNVDIFGNMFPGIMLQTPVYTQNGTEKQDIGGGSGFLISPDGLIVTNRHVVEDTTADYTVILNNGKKYTAKILARDPVLDVAVIKITASGLPYLDLADSSTIEAGQSVIAIGNALGQFKNTVSVGVISGLARSITAGDSNGSSEKLDKVIQTDAAINPGNSGGPLLNLAGQVVGINVAVVQGSESIGFALPINSVKNVINQVSKTGKLSRPYVGVRYVAITPELKASNNLTVDYGVLVRRGPNASDVAIVPGSPADKAGIIENDIILEVDGVKINQDQDMAALIRNKKVGNTIKLKILSKGVEKIVSVKLEAAPDNS